MHLGLIGFWRRRQARAVLLTLEALEEPRPTIMMGDLNEWTVDGGCLAMFARHHHVASPGPSFHLPRPVAALARTITTRDLRIEQAGLPHSHHSSLPSAHLPLSALSVAAGPPRAPGRRPPARTPGLR